MRSSVVAAARATLAVLPLFVLCAPVCAAWTSVGNGIEYQEFHTADPNNLFVARMDRDNASASLETSIANGTISGARETVRSQASRYDESLSWWGQAWGARNDVIVAVNGDFFNGTTGVVTGGQCHSGWYSKRWSEWGGYSGFGWNNNRLPFIGGCVHHISSKQYITFAASGKTMEFQNVNVPRGSEQLIVYTPQYNSTTLTDSSGSEVLVEVERPTVIIQSPNKVVGHVRQIRQNQGSTYIPFDHIVLSATGTKATTLLNNVSIGAEVWINQYPTDYNEPDIHGEGGCAYATGLDWTKAMAAIGVNYRFLENGEVRPPDPAHSGYAGLVVRNPRTAVAYNANYVFFVVCDGRSTSSVGMTMTELANFCKNTLGATDGANLDGGGSSTMVVNGVVKNNPSDGSERAVANGIMMVNILPKTLSTRFATGQPVVVNTNGTNVRLGPGTNYGILATKNKNAQGTIVEHAIKGVLAKGYYWWKVDFGGGTVGWVAETLLDPGNVPPSITQHPQPRTVCPDGTALFSVTATGSGTLSYRWQKNRTDLSDGGHYSGVATASLTVSNCDASDAADYRCVVTSSYGSATSNEAALTVPPVVDPISSAWALPDGIMLSLQSKVVTAVVSGAFWLEEADRSAAIKVLSSAGVSKGAVICVAGSLGLSGTQRALTAAYVNAGGTAPVPQPLGMALRDLGGAAFNALTPGVTGSSALYSIGLLVRCCGKVTHSDSSNPADRSFYFDDGGGATDGGPYPGIRVRCGSVMPPASGFVVVTGIITSEQAGGLVVAVIRIRDASDIVSL